MLVIKEAHLADGLIVSLPGPQPAWPLSFSVDIPGYWNLSFYGAHTVELQHSLLLFCIMNHMDALSFNSVTALIIFMEQTYRVLFTRLHLTRKQLG